MIVTYYLFGAAVAAWLTVGSKQLEWSVALLLLPSLFFVHVVYMLLQGKPKRNTPVVALHRPKCLACRRNLGLFQKLLRGRFCSAEHERLYLEELEKIALTRLANARTAAESARPIPDDVSVDLTSSKETQAEQNLCFMIHPSRA